MIALEGMAGRFLALHRPGRPLLQPNAWDIGSAKLLVALGFEAIATTSGGFAASLDGSVSRVEALAHGPLAVAVSVPVATDTENCFADDPDGVAETVRGPCPGSAGCSVEDFTRGRATPSMRCRSPRHEWRRPRMRPMPARRSWC